jgi:hypothetical protein
MPGKTSLKCPHKLLRAGFSGPEVAQSKAKLAGSKMDWFQFLIVLVLVMGNKI